MKPTDPLPETQDWERIPPHPGDPSLSTTLYYICPVCAAMVPGNHAQQHRDWHEQQREKQ
jgi:hypothetical protein